MERIYDVTILGASGFTGKYVVREALKFLNSPDSPLKSLALAGRTQSRLSQALKWAAAPDLAPHIPLLYADSSDPDSLRRVAAQTKVLLNCVGPFRLHGEPVVAACVEAGCHYLDISGEPEFMEKMESMYQEAAAEKGSLVVSACGFDSIPAEIGLMFHSKQWSGKSAPNQVDAYLRRESDKKIVVNFGTYESAILGVANADKLVEFRRSRPRRPLPQIPGVVTKSPSIVHQKELGLWGLRQPCADATVIRRTLSTLKENPHGLPGINESAEDSKKREAFWASIKPAHFSVKNATKSRLGLIPFMMLGFIIGLLSRYSFGRWLLLNFPWVFTMGTFQKAGPTEDQVSSASFKMWFVGQGYSDVSSVASDKEKKPDTEVITRVMGPENGYVATPKILIQCALVVLTARGNLPKGGVYTPGIVFGATDLEKRLQENGISFDFISRRTIS